MKLGLPPLKTSGNNAADGSLFIVWMASQMTFTEQISNAVNCCGMTPRAISRKSIIMAAADGGVILDEPALCSFRKKGLGFSVRRLDRLAEIIGLKVELKKKPGRK